MKKILLALLFFHVHFICYGQSELQFNDVFNATISGEKMGMINLLQEESLIIEKGTIVKITSSAISEISTFDGTPNVLSDSKQGMLFLNDYPVTTMPEADVQTVQFPIWLKAGIYKLKLVAHINSSGKKLKGIVNGIKYNIKD